jgi:hypothetical protein
MWYDHTRSSDGRRRRLLVRNIEDYRGKRTLIAEIGQIEMSKEGDLLLLVFARMHAVVPSESPQEGNQ